MEVANLEGWDTSQLRKHLDNCDTYSKESIEALSLKYGELSQTARQYLRLRAKRNDAFWETCRIQNATWLQEWVDLRSFVKTLKARLVKKVKNEKGKVENHSHANQEDSE